MPEYLSPGVYVEEVSSGLKPIEGVGTSTGAFIGIAQKGPICGVKYGNEVGRPVLITNFGDFVRNFGSFYNGEYLAYAVQQFFAEGGTRCYVARTAAFENIADPVAIKVTATRASATLKDATTADTMTVEALNEGEWGNNLRVAVSAAGRISTTLTAAMAADATQAVVASLLGIEVGMSLFIGAAGSAGARVQVTRIEPDDSRITFRNLDSSPVPAVANGANVKAIKSGAVLTALSADVAAADTEAILDSTIGIEIGTVLLFVSEDLATSTIVEDRLVVNRVVGKRVFFESGFTAAMTAGTIVSEESFSIAILDGDNIVETHENLSLEDANITNFAPNRLNEGGSRSRYIRVSNTGGNALPVTLADPTPLAGGTDDNGTAEQDTDYIGNEATQTGFHAFDSVDAINILNAPGQSRNVIIAGMSYCENRQDVFYVGEVTDSATTVTEVLDFKNATGPYAGEQAINSTYGAIYWPWVRVLDPVTGRPITVPPAGAIVGSYSAADVRRGVHKAPAGTTDGFLNSVVGIQKIVTKGEHDLLNPAGVNVIRSFPGLGIVIWGARTTSSDAEWRYVNVRRLFLFLEESIDEGTQWVVFEPNDPLLWANIVRNISAFLRIQWLEGKLVGNKQEEAFFVKCDAETNPPESVDLGRVITEIGVAPSKPAEFVIFRIMQKRPE